jgi:hypothetical protein
MHRHGKEETPYTLAKRFSCGDPHCTELHSIRLACHPKGALTIIRCSADENIIHAACVQCNANYLSAVVLTDGLPDELMQACHPEAGSIVAYDPWSSLVMLHCHECEANWLNLLSVERFQLAKIKAQMLS